MHTRDARRGDLGLSRFARVLNADTMACTIVAGGLVGGITFSVLLANLIIAWHASDEEGDGPNAEREKMEQLLEWPGFEDVQSIRNMVCDAKASDEGGDGPSAERKEMEQQLSEGPGFEDEQSIQKMVCDANASDEEGDDPNAALEEMERQLSELICRDVMHLTPLRDGTSVVAQNRGRGRGRGRGRRTPRAIKWESEVVHASGEDRRPERYDLKDSEQDKEAKEAKEGGRGYGKLGKLNALSSLSVTKLNPTLGQ